MGTCDFFFPLPPLPVADGSGVVVDREELAPLLRGLGILASAQTIEEAFSWLDPECSGDIRREELCAWLDKVM